MFKNFTNDENNCSHADAYKRIVKRELLLSCFFRFYHFIVFWNNCDSIFHCINCLFNHRNHLVWILSRKFHLLRCISNCHPHHLMFLTLLRSLLHSLHSQDLLKYIPLYWKCRLASYAVLEQLLLHLQ